MPRTSGRITVDLSPLRADQINKVIIRFTDINEASKKKLAQRIKETCPIYKIRKSNGPTIEQVYQGLIEIDPIVFSEHPLASYHRIDSARNFNIFEVKGIFGYYYRKLCSELYHLLCLRRPLRKRELVNIAYLTNGDWNKADLYIERNIPNSIRTENPIQEVTIPRIEEFGIEEMNQVQRATASRERDSCLRRSYETNDIPGFNNTITATEATRLYPNTTIGYSGFSGNTPLQVNPNPEPLENIEDLSIDELIEEGILTNNN